MGLAQGQQLPATEMARVTGMVHRMRTGAMHGRKHQRPALLEELILPPCSLPVRRSLVTFRFHLWTNLGGNLDSRSCSRWCSQGWHIILVPVNPCPKGSR